MPILVIFLVAGLIYLLQDRIYKKFWNVNLHVDVKFEDKFIHEGEDTYLKETLSNEIDKNYNLNFVQKEYLKFIVSFF